ncbi:MAG: hypothetical protein HY040_27885 [Planctomycetes bacterium]|nr:hypothetical protein [Planctomycetota bacterium]
MPLGISEIHSCGTVLVEAIRRFLEARQPELMERFIREDIEWGCAAEADPSSLVICDGAL